MGELGNSAGDGHGDLVEQMGTVRRALLEEGRDRWRAGAEVSVVHI